MVLVTQQVTQLATSLPSAIVLGATGAVGRCLVTQLAASGHYRQVYAVVRQLPKVAWQATDAQAKIVPVLVPDFTRLAHTLKMYNFEPEDLNHADAFSALGSTQKQAGGKEAFKAIDFGYNLAFAQAIQQRGVQRFFLVSALGADSHSKIFYNRIKGELEKALADLAFKHLAIFRPSLLLTYHAERLGEHVMVKIAQFALPLIPAHFAYRPIEPERVAAAMVRVATEQATALPAQQYFENTDLLQLSQPIADEIV